MLSQVYEVDGKKNRTYKDAVFNILGGGHRTTLATVLYGMGLIWCMGKGLTPHHIDSSFVAVTLDMC